LQLARHVAQYIVSFHNVLACYTTNIQQTGF
jgi:hypothetical protein